MSGGFDHDAGAVAVRDFTDSSHKIRLTCVNRVIGSDAERSFQSVRVQIGGDDGDR